MWHFPPFLPWVNCSNNIYNVFQILKIECPADKLSILSALGVNGVSLFHGGLLIDKVCWGLEVG